MISAPHTTVFYSAHSYADFKPQVEEIRAILNNHGIEFLPLAGTEDYFCRDYMPVQKDEQNLVQFKFKPDYLLNNPTNKNYVSEPLNIIKKNAFLKKFIVKHSNIILDGGNLVRHGNLVVTTNKILKDNPTYTEQEIKVEIGELLGVKVIIIPRYPDEETGHVDGILRFINEDTVLTICLEDEDDPWKSALLSALHQENLKVISLPLLPENRENQWAYVNYLQVDSVMILPSLNETNDKIIEPFFKEHFKGKEIHLVDFRKILLHQGAVNCFTWDIIHNLSNEEINITEHKYIREYPINPDHKKLILGTIHPHDDEFKIDFFYGNKCTLWHILHDAFPDLLENPEDKESVKDFLKKTGTSISDTVLKCKRLSASAADEDFIPLTLNHQLIEQIKNSSIDEIFFTSGFGKNNAFKLFYEDILKHKITPTIKIERHVMLPNEVFGRPVKLTILYSPSGAANLGLMNSELFKNSKTKYEQYNDPVKQFKVDYYRERFGYVTKKVLKGFNA